MVKKPGRPQLPPSERREKISTTIPREVAESIRAHRWKFNDVLIDGYSHRCSCGDKVMYITRLEANIAKLQRVIADIEMAHAPLKAGNSTDTAGMATEE